MTDSLKVPLPMPTDHPALVGHFPGHPIYPGVVLLDAAIGVIESHFSAPVRSIPVAKFHAPVRPGMAVTLGAELDDGQVRFELTSSDGTRIANGTARLKSTDTPRAQGA